MIVTCPGCDANYRVPNEKVPKGGARMRCPQCETEFLAMLPDDDGSEAPPPPPKPRIPPPPAAAGAHTPPPGAPPAAGPLPSPSASSASLPQANVRTSLPGFPMPAPGASGTMPVVAPRPNPFAKPAASQPAMAFGEASLPPAGTPVPSPLASPPGSLPGASGATPPAIPPAIPPGAGAVASAPPGTRPAPVSPPPLPGPPPPPPEARAPAIPPTPPPAAFASPPTPPPAPPPSPIASPFAPAPPPPPAAALAPSPTSGAAPYGATPPAPPPGAFASPSPPPPAPAEAVGRGIDFDPLADDLFGSPESEGAAVPREITGLFSALSAPTASQPPPPPPEALVQPSPPPLATAPAVPAPGDSGTGLPRDEAFDLLDPFGGEGASSSGPSPLAGAAPGDDDDLFAALFDTPPAPAEGASQASSAAASAAIPPPPVPEGKATMKAALARAMDAKERAAALKEEHSPIRRGAEASSAADERSLSPAPGAHATAEPAAAAISPPKAEAPPETRPAQRPEPQRTSALAGGRSFAEAAAWGMLLASTLVLVGGVIFTAWTTGLVPLDDALMPHAERHLGVRPPWSHLGLDEPALEDLEKAAVRARESKDLALEAAAWRRVLARNPEHPEAQRRLRKVLSLLGDARAVEAEKAAKRAKSP